MSATIERLVLFGATGDLAGRYLLPALAQLLADGHLPPGFRVVGAARDELDDAGFRQHAAAQLDRHAADLSPEARSSLVDALHYRPVDLEDPSSVAAVVGSGPEPLAAYLALPPTIFETAVRSLGEAGLPAGSRIVLEKPFGHDLASARRLNALLDEVADPASVFRVDHVLGMATVQNMVAARLGSRVLEPLWSSTHIAQVDILWDETIALEGRAGYYDGAGALVDVIQNHLLQIMSLVAMEPPSGVAGADLAQRKADVLRAVRIPTIELAARETTRARYIAGTLAPPPHGAGTPVPAYVDEDGVDPALGTETFAEIVLHVDNPRWAGTPFVLRGAKAMQRRHKGVIVRFRPVPSPFPDHQPEPDELRIGLDGPEDVSLHLAGGVVGPPAQPFPLVLDGALPAGQQPAYAQVLRDVLSGGGALSVGGDEAELAWQIVEPFLAAWDAGTVPLQEYPAGSLGPPHRLAAHPTGPGDR